MKQFEKIRVKKPQTSVFNLSHERKFTCDMGELIPVLVSEVLPGDKFKISMESLVRLQPMLAPIMHRVNVYTHFFFVPYRIIWDDFEEFITGGVDGTSEVVVPQFQDENSDFLTACGVGTLADYLGYPSANIPDNNDPAEYISQLPFRAYQQIYNDYYRDQTLEPEITFNKTSTHSTVTGTNGVKTLTLRKRCWEKDYFTSALPWAQRGNTVTLPISGSAPVTGIPILENDDETVPPNGITITTVQDIGGEANLYNSSQSKKLNVVDGLEANLSDASSSTINEVRRAFAIQRWLEKNARGGSRYIEQMLSHFGVKSKDSRLQRAEYLGGGKQPVIISEVLQNSSSTEEQPLGDMGGHGYSAGTSASFTKYFTEHGIVLGIMSVMPRTSYSQGLPKLFSKFDKFDFYFPDLAHIGEQAVYKKELYLNNGEGDEETFGYQPRYSEYRFMHDTIHGEMRTLYNYWHMGREFESQPALNNDFVQADPTKRIFALQGSQEEDALIIQTYCNFMAIRPVSKFGDPI